MVPESVWRWASLGSRGASVWRGSADGTPAELYVDALPSPAAIRWLAAQPSSAAGAAAPQRPTVFNLCGWWGGWSELCAELGVELQSLPTGEVYVVAQAGA